MRLQFFQFCCSRQTLMQRRGRFGKMWPHGGQEVKDRRRGRRRESRRLRKRKIRQRKRRKVAAGSRGMKAQPVRAPLG